MLWTVWPLQFGHKHHATHFLVFLNFFKIISATSDHLPIISATISATSDPYFRSLRLCVPNSARGRFLPSDFSTAFPRMPPHLSTCFNLSYYVALLLFAWVLLQTACSSHLVPTSAVVTILRFAFFCCVAALGTLLPHLIAIHGSF